MPASRRNMKTDVAVVVATYRRKERLERLLRALERQTLGRDRFEVVVVDDASGDGTADELSRLSSTTRLQLRLLTRQTNGGPAAARNDGWRATEASVVAFTDDDCVPVPEWLETGLTRLKRDGGIVVGRTAPAPDQQHLLAPFTRTVVVDDTRFLQCCNVFYCRDDLLANGGFDERLRTGEDTDLGLRVLESGRVAHFEPAALVHHDVRSADLRATLRESAAWVDLPLVVRKHPGLRTTHLHRRIFWKRSHPPVLAAFAGIALAATGRRALGVGLLFPWLWHRTRTAPVPARALAGTLAVDAVEVATMVRGSLRHGTLVL